MRTVEARGDRGVFFTCEAMSDDSPKQRVRGHADMNGFQGFGTGLTAFLEDLRSNNERSWFTANRGRYEEAVREPALAFIRAMAPALAAVSPHFRADDRKSGGSLMRVHRDTRFSRDKTPCKTNLGIQFRHALGRDVHAPGFYVHVEPDGAFFAAGVWRPGPGALAMIRARIHEEPGAWRRTRDAKPFRASFTFGGESLKTIPRGFPKDHPLAEDLRRKDFIAIHEVPLPEALEPDFPNLVAARMRDARGFMRFLCQAIDVPF